jgi:hypothetical protein
MVGTEWVSQHHLDGVDRWQLANGSTVDELVRLRLLDNGDHDHHFDSF